MTKAGWAKTQVFLDQIVHTFYHQDKFAVLRKHIFLAGRFSDYRYISTIMVQSCSVAYVAYVTEMNKWIDTNESSYIKTPAFAPLPG